MTRRSSGSNRTGQRFGARFREYRIGFLDNSLVKSLMPT